MKILIRGGSIAAGTGVSAGYANILAERCRLAGVEVINRSAPNDTSFDGVRSFREDVVPEKPEILILHFGVDDAYLAVYRSEFKENLVQMVRLARISFDPVTILLTSHPFEDPYDRDVMDIYYRVIQEVSCELSCEMVPVHTYWQGHIADRGCRHRDLVQGDVRYPNETGHAVFAEAIMPTLMRIIGQSAGC
ncbi:MAG: hypothetical protein CSYNP_02997 [Syntrophus sp. SKADARSKE-3]|nr:hypothetical protein [Syntrophus sp. SKADARSKE-3]